tara:strand:+ start:222 stop:575 length:354 start_codon:yes stop_codon:yes gene_type:complete
MAIPSGSGTEVLKRVSLHAVTNSFQAIITGVANHIYTILSVVVCEQGEAAELFNMRVDVSAAGSNQIRLLEQQPIPAFGTFVFNDKIVLSGTDKLEVGTDGPANVDVYVSYIDQDWS